MNNKLINGIKTNVALSAVVLVAFALATIPFHLVLGLAELAVAAAVIYVGVRRNRQAQANVRQQPAVYPPAHDGLRHDHP